MEKKSIVVFPNSFPYELSSEDAFLIPELSILSEKMQILIVPLKKGGKKFSTPSGINVLEDFADIYSKKFLLVLKAIFEYDFWKFFIKEIFTKKRVLTSISCLRSLIIHLIYSISFKNWLLNQRIIQLDNSKIIFYSYWMTFAATSLAMLKSKKRIEGTIISRAHGYDLYEFRHKKDYLPFRNFVVENIDYIVTVSKEGSDYLAKRYPPFKDKIKFYPLGIIREMGNVSSPSMDSSFRIVSCSAVIPLKRVERIARLMLLLAFQYNNLSWEWTHIGNGIRLESIKESLKKKKPSNLKVHFTGFIDNNKVIEFYKNNFVDLFINLSETEGRPVSILEALSFGIPILATDVGGVGELVINNRNGFLIPVNCSLEEIATKIYFLRINRGLADKMRKESLEIFYREADANKNYLQFADFLLKL